MLRGWQTPSVDRLKLVNYPRIDNAHKIRKKILVVCYVAVICTITKGKEQIRAGVFSGVASPEIRGGQKIMGGKMSDFRRITVFCFEKRLSKYKMTISSKNLGVHGPFAPWLRPWV